METIEDDTHHVPTDWSHLFTWHRNPYYGYCETGEQVDELIELFSYLSSTSFVVTRTTKNFGQINGCLFKVCKYVITCRLSDVK